MCFDSCANRVSAVNVETSIDRCTTKVLYRQIDQNIKERACEKMALNLAKHLIVSVYTRPFFCPIVVAFYLIADEDEKNEFEPAGMRGRDTLETGELDGSLFDWRPSYAQERA